MPQAPSTARPLLSCNEALCVAYQIPDYHYDEFDCERIGESGGPGFYAPCPASWGPHRRRKRAPAAIVSTGSTTGVTASQFPAASFGTSREGPSAIFQVPTKPCHRPGPPPPPPHQLMKMIFPGCRAIRASSARRRDHRRRHNQDMVGPCSRWPRWMKTTEWTKAAASEADPAAAAVGEQEDERG